MGQRSRFQHSLALFLAAAILAGWIAAAAAAVLEEDQDQQESSYTMDPIEKEAFYKVMESLNDQWDWRTLLPDPCGDNTLQGMICDIDPATPSLIHLIGLGIGKIHSNTPACSANATIHPSIANLSYLKSLSFHGCFFGSPASIHPAIASISSLSSLTFQNNPSLTGPIPAELATLAQLDRLILVANALNGSIPLELGSLGSIQQLVVSQNPGIQGAVPRTLKYLSNLVILDLSHNGLDSIANLSLASLDRLRKVDLAGNSIDAPLESLLESLPQGVELLDLSHNLFRGKNSSRSSSLDGLVAFDRLRELYLQGNPIREPIPSMDWGRLRSIISMDLSSSQMSGAIPSTLGNLQRLRFLGLAKNSLSGAIPGEIAAMGQLAEIDLRENSLAGPVLFSIESIQRLGSKLKLGNNTGLCYPPRILSMINASSSSSSSSSSFSIVSPQELLQPCDESTIPVAFQVGSVDSRSSPPSSSSSSSSISSRSSSNSLFRSMVCLIAIAATFVL